MSPPLIKSSKNKYNYMGVFKAKGGRNFCAEIRDPFLKKKVRIHGSFRTAEEAAIAYAKKRSEFEARKGMSEKENDSTSSVAELTKEEGDENESEFQESNVMDTEEVEQSRTAEASIKSSKNKNGYLGVKKSGNKFYAVTRDPVSGKRVNLGSFDTPEEAGQMYAKKRSEFEARKGMSEKENDSTSSVAESADHSSADELTKEEGGEENESGFQEDNAMDTEEVEQSRTAVASIKSWKNKNGYIGVKKRGHRFYAMITDPVLKKRVNLGFFYTPEEAGQMYAKKRREFDAQQGFDSARHDVTLSKEAEKGQKLDEEDNNVEVSDMKEVEELDDSDMTEVEEIDEGNNKVDVSDRKEVEEIDEENNKVDESDMKEVEEDTRFGYYNGVQIFDEDGLMVGEFAHIDDLKVCCEEGLDF